MITKNSLKCQIAVCYKIIKAIETNQYREASVLIRFYLNDNNYLWYKNVESIINDQINNLFIDIEQEFKNNYTVDFFKKIISELKFEIETDLKYLELE